MSNFLVSNLMKILPYTIRRFSLSTTPGRNKYQVREARIMNKFISSSKKKRRYFIGECPNHSGGALNLGKELRPSKENNRRVAVLNKLFIKHISDLLSTGSFSANILDKGLEISSVKMASDFKHLNVYWTSNNDKNLKTLEELLPGLGFKLRDELSQLRVMGNVPRIIFVKDKQHAFAIQVDHLLRIADYGDDHVAIESVSDFKNSQESELSISQSQEHGVNKDDGDDESKGLQSDLEFMPAMIHDVFNLDHSRIMKKVVKSMHKARALHRYEPNLSIACEGINNSPDEVIYDTLSKQERKMAISKFILKRKLQQIKQNRSDRFNSDINHPSFQISENNDHDNDEDDDFFVEEDYIEEDNFEDKRYN